MEALSLSNLENPNFYLSRVVFILPARVYPLFAKYTSNAYPKTLRA